MSKIIEVKDVKKEYGSKTKCLALKGIDLEVYQGEFIGIMGPSGSGKTTLLNMLSTIDKQTSGKIMINGKNVSAMGDLEISKFRYENMGFIFQEFNLIGTITIGENIAIPLSLSSELSKDKIREKVIKVAERMGIGELVDKFPYECSGGQRQRVAIARALANDPSIIVADEPTGNLDTKNSHDLLRLLEELNEKENKTIIMVTHDSMIASYTKKVVFIRDGNIEETIEREGLEQKEFFYRIVDINSKESRDLFNQMEIKR